MVNTIIREIQGAEMLEIMYWLNQYAFHSSPPMADKAEWQEQRKQRVGSSYFALFEDAKPVASVGCARMTQQVRGAVFKMVGLCDVVTHPAARRKGYARRTLERALAALRAEGRAFSCLYPFNESFYERLGYITLPHPRVARFAPAVLAPLLDKDLGGEVELMLIGEGYAAYRDYEHKLQQRVHGVALYEHDQAASARRNTAWLALARVAGEPVGLMTYDLKGERIAQFTLRARRFYYHTGQGKYLLLAWIARHLGQANQVEMRLPPFETPETWLADIQPTLEPTFPPPMARVLDVAGMVGMHTQPGRFSARIHDPLCAWNERIWRFETVNGALQVSAADAADCDLGIQGLTALAYGTHDPGEFIIRGWGNPSSQVQATLRAMFPPMLPYLHEAF